MPDGDAIRLVREVRNGQLGRNPFVPIILTVWDSDGISIDEAVNSGVDLILAKPLRRHSYSRASTRWSLNESRSW